MQREIILDSVPAQELKKRLDAFCALFDVEVDTVLVSVKGTFEEVKIQGLQADKTGDLVFCNYAFHRIDPSLLFRPHDLVLLGVQGENGPEIVRVSTEVVIDAVKFSSQ